MAFIAIPSLPMSDATRQAWKSQYGIFPRRSRSTEEIIRLANDQGAAFILNLGRSSFNSDWPLVWNNGPDIYDLLWPGNTRRLFDDIMPSRPTSFPTAAWVKTPGYGGRGKYLLDLDGPLVLPDQWDWQSHIDGDEYRLITVGHRVVQQHQRHGQNGERTYSWLPAEGLPEGLRSLAKNAARRVPGRNVIAWDFIVPNDGSMGQALLFEGNTCPGVNTATAERIVKEILRQQEETNNATG